MIDDAASKQSSHLSPGNDECPDDDFFPIDWKTLIRRQWGGFPPGCTSSPRRSAIRRPQPARRGHAPACGPDPCRRQPGHRQAAGAYRRQGADEPVRRPTSEGERQRIVAQLGEEAIALVSDAGTPLISDPGYKLVRAARGAARGPHGPRPLRRDRGLDAGRASYRPFPLPRLPSGQGQGAQRRHRRSGSVRATLVFYEGGPRLAETLLALSAELGERDAAICRELTKLHEECVTGTLPELAATLCR